MNITKRLFAYPVLNKDNNDYNSSIFNMDVQCEVTGVSTISLDVDIIMDNEELLQLVFNGDAEFIVHIECTATSYREVKKYVTCEKHRIDIPSSKINGKMEVLAMLVLKKNIFKFVNSDWNEDYEGFTFDLDKGSILAYDNVPTFDIIKNFEELSSTTSIFKINKRLTDDIVPMKVELGTEFIHIWLGNKDYGLYSSLAGKIGIQQILNALFITPALIYVFEELKQENGIENHEYKRWFISLTKSYEKRGLHLIDEIEDPSKTSVQLAQEAMEYPLNSALIEISEVFNKSGESEEE